MRPNDRIVSKYQFFSESACASYVSIDQITAGENEILEGRRLSLQVPTFLLRHSTQVPRNGLVVVDTDFGVLLSCMDQLPEAVNVGWITKDWMEFDFIKYTRLYNHRIEIGTWDPEWVANSQKEWWVMTDFSYEDVKMIDCVFSQNARKLVSAHRGYNFRWYPGHVYDLRTKDRTLQGSKREGSFNDGT